VILRSAVNSLAKLVGYIRGVARNVYRLAAGALPFTAAEDADWWRRAFADDVRRNFQESRGPDLTPWAPLKYRLGKPLILTGALMAAAVGTASRAAWDGAVATMPQMSAPRYWSYHQYGAGRVPARPFYGPRPDTVRELAERAAARATAAVQEE
jgi:phage gpG-like protein